VGMIQRRERFRLAFESGQAIGVRGERVGQDLYRHLADSRRIRRPVDLPHPPFADRRGDFVDAEARAGCQGQDFARLYGTASRNGPRFSDDAGKSTVLPRSRAPPRLVWWASGRQRGGFAPICLEPTWLKHAKFLRS
jgi:hypothetical protein